MLNQQSSWSIRKFFILCLIGSRVWGIFFFIATWSAVIQKCDKNFSSKNIKKFSERVFFLCFLDLGLGSSIPKFKKTFFGKILEIFQASGYKVLSQNFFRVFFLCFLAMGWKVHQMAPIFTDNRTIFFFSVKYRVWNLQSHEKSC